MNVVFLALPSSHRALLRNLAVAVRCSSLPSLERFDLVLGSVSLPELGEAYPDCAAEMGVIAALDWQTPFLGGYLGGLEFLDDAQWARLQARLPSLPSGVRYARWRFATDCRQSVLAETNIVSLLPHVGERSGSFFPLLETYGFTPVRE